MFTLQSRKNGKFISSIEVEQHRIMFNAISKDDAYIWSQFDSVWRYVMSNNLYCVVDVRVI